MSWLFLIISGLGEVGGVTSMKLSDGFRRWKGTVATAISFFISLFFLSQAIREIPISTAYGIWTGIGSIGSVLLGMFYFGESKDWRKLAFIGLIIVGVIGLKAVSGA